MISHSTTLTNNHTVTTPSVENTMFFLETNTSISNRGESLKNESSYQNRERIIERHNRDMMDLTPPPSNTPQRVNLYLSALEFPLSGDLSCIALYWNSSVFNIEY